MPSKKRLQKKIDCPHCFVTMKQKEVEIFGPNVIIDFCPRCEGTWLDGGELKRLVGNKRLSDYLTKEIGTKSSSKLVCPRCSGLMDIEKADDVEVDVCLDCRGVWLDSGELKDLKKKKGFKGDDDDKAVERWEEMVKRDKQSGLNRFFRKILR